MKLGDLRRMTADLPDETKLEICDENTEEVYEIYEMHAMAFKDCHTETLDGKTNFKFQLTTNVGFQTNAYRLDIQKIMEEK